MRRAYTLTSWLSRGTKILAIAIVASVLASALASQPASRTFAAGAPDQPQPTDAFPIAAGGAT